MLQPSDGMPRLCRLPHVRPFHAPGLSARLLHQMPRHRSLRLPLRRRQVNSADQPYLVIESVKWDTQHMWSSTAHAPVDGAEGSSMF